MERGLSASWSQKWKFLVLFVPPYSAARSEERTKTADAGDQCESTDMSILCRKPMLPAAEVHACIVTSTCRGSRGSSVTDSTDTQQSGTTSVSSSGKLVDRATAHSQQVTGEGDGVKGCLLVSTVVTTLVASWYCEADIHDEDVLCIPSRLQIDQRTRLMPLFLALYYDDGSARPFILPYPSCLEAQCLGQHDQARERTVADVDSRERAPLHTAI
jgi:hypothetical protein